MICLHMDIKMNSLDMQITGSPKGDALIVLRLAKLR